MESDFGSRIFILLILVLLIVGVGNLFHSYALGAGEFRHSIIALDRIGVGQHHLTGVIVLPQCSRFSLQVTELSNSAEHLSFKTWGDPARECPPLPSEHTFQTIIFAPSFGTTFTADIDGAPIPISIIRDY